MSKKLSIFEIAKMKDDETVEEFKERQEIENANKPPRQSAIGFVIKVGLAILALKIFGPILLGLFAVILAAIAQ